MKYLCIEFQADKPLIDLYRKITNKNEYFFRLVVKANSRKEAEKKCTEFDIYVSFKNSIEIEVSYEKELCDKDKYGLILSSCNRSTKSYVTGEEIRNSLDLK